MAMADAPAGQDLVSDDSHCETQNTLCQQKVSSSMGSQVGSSVRPV